MKIHSDSTGHDKNILLFSVLIGLLVIDVSLIKIQDFITSEALSEWRTYVFTALSIVTIAGQFLLLRYVRQHTLNFRSRNYLQLDSVHKSVILLQFLIIFVLLSVNVQMVFSESYDTILLIILVIISSFLGAGIMAILGIRFFQWLMSRRSSVVLSYGLVCNFDFL